MFDHVQIKVDDLAGNRPFYEAIFAALGYACVFEVPDVVIGFGTSIHSMFEVRQASSTAPVSQAVHIAFKARSETAVRAFHRAALQHGGRDNGPPGPRPEYEEGYFAAFVIDPNGHNLEAVFSSASH